MELSLSTQSVGGSLAKRMTIDADGNVGIGTASPGAMLDVAGTVNANAFVGDGSGLSNLPIMEGLWNEGIEGNINYNGGNVGIGTAGPQVNLHIQELSEDARIAVERVFLGSKFANLVAAQDYAGLGYENTGSFRTGPVASVNSNPESNAGIVLDESGNVPFPGSITGPITINGDIVAPAQGVALDQVVDGTPEVYIVSMTETCQSFTAGASGALTQIDSYFRSQTTTESGTLDIYEGDEASGTLLSSESVAISVEETGWVSFPLSSQPIEKAGTLYNYVLHADSGKMTLGAHTDYPYARGATGCGDATSNFDQLFRTYVGTRSSITAGAFIGNGSGFSGLTDQNVAGAWATDGSTYYYNLAGGRVGIGMADPSTTVEVESNHPELRITNNDTDAGGTANITLGKLPWYSRDASYDGGYGSLAEIGILTDNTTVAPDGRFVFRTSTNGTSNTAMQISSSGRVGILKYPNNNELEVECNASKSSAGSWLAYSDRRIKTNIQTIDDALDTLDRVRLVSFEYTDDYKAGHAGVGNGRYLNVIAQEFAEVFPDLVKGSGELLPDGSEILQVDPYPLTIYSAAAIQELHDLIRQKDQENAALREEISSINKRLARLESRDNTLYGHRGGTSAHKASSGEAM